MDEERWSPGMVLAVAAAIILIALIVAVKMRDCLPGNPFSEQQSMEDK
jgi:hypothetical protein